MKHRETNSYLNPLIYLLIAVVICSCSDNNTLEYKQLSRAETLLAEGEAGRALYVLDSIQNGEILDKEAHMRYLLTYIGGKKEIDSDISGDSVIFEVQRYFADKHDTPNAALASYYAGWVCYVNKQLPRSLEFFMGAVDAAEKTENKLLAARSYNNIGYIYYEQRLFDDALINYQKALSYYTTKEGTIPGQLRVLTYIGSSYEALNQFDSAYLYFDKCLSLAKERNNKAYEFYSLKNLGVVSYGKNDYDKAIDYFKTSLAMQIPNEIEPLEIQKIHLYLLNTYNKKRDPRLGKEYASLVLADLPKVKYKYTVKEMYTALSDYYLLLGDSKQSLDYENLSKATQTQIDKENEAQALLAAEKKFRLLQQKQEKAESNNTFMVMIVGSVAFLTTMIAVFALLLKRYQKKCDEVIDRQITKIEIMRKHLRDARSHYDTVETNIKRMTAETETKC